MTAPALRVLACAGALATSLLLAGTGAGTSLADTEGVGATGTQDTPTPDGAVKTPGETPGEGPKPDGTPGDGSPADDSHRPTSTVGNGRNDVVDPNESIADIPGGDAKPARKYRSSVLVPVLRIPTWKEFQAPGPTPLSAYFGTAEVGVPFLADILGYSQPEPEPTPGPAFRTQEEAPVIDATPGDGGGVDQVDGAAAGPPLFEVPLVVAPPMPAAPRPPLGPIGGAAARAPVMTAGAQPAAAGARAPLIRGSLPPSGQTVTRPLNQANNQPSGVGYPRYLRNPTVGELSLIALPGVAGLMFLTFSGGVIGYRQANSARFVRTAGAERFLA